ncbi:MAG: KEOPS complex kinase/ATPase Bud32 [Candidatus Diapherotrites archaeon]
MAGKAIARGAEAEILEIELGGGKAAEKHRLAKGYRCRELDEKIRLERTRLEAMLLHRAKGAGVRTPLVLAVDPEKKSIFMEFVEGKNAKFAVKGNLKLCREIGKQIAALHSADIIHGDLTTDNILATGKADIVFIDFGLGFNSKKEEDKAVDLINLKKTLLAGDASLKKEWNAILKAYVACGGSREIAGKIEEIERRGRYS